MRPKQSVAQAYNHRDQTNRLYTTPINGLTEAELENLMLVCPPQSHPNQHTDIKMAAAAQWILRFHKDFKRWHCATLPILLDKIEVLLAGKTSSILNDKSCWTDDLKKLMKRELIRYWLLSSQTERSDAEATDEKLFKGTVLARLEEAVDRGMAKAVRAATDFTRRISPESASPGSCGLYTTMAGCGYSITKRTSYDAATGEQCIGYAVHQLSEYMIDATLLIDGLEPKPTTWTFKRLGNFVFGDTALTREKILLARTAIFQLLQIPCGASQSLQPITEEMTAILDRLERMNATASSMAIKKSALPFLKTNSSGELGQAVLRIRAQMGVTVPDVTETQRNWGCAAPPNSSRR